MKTRLSKVQKQIVKHVSNAILISKTENITYLTNFSGFSKDEREAFLFITKNKQYILTDGRYSTAVKNQIKEFELIEISPKNPMIKILNALKTKHKIKTFGLEENNLTVSEHKKISKHFNDTYHHSVSNLRIIKSKSEINAIEKACELGDKTFDYILKKIKKGISEKELAFEIEFFIKKHGADISFPPIVAFGKNSAIPHHVPTMNYEPLTTNSIVLLDFGVRLNNYCSDMTRTVFFGKPTPEQKRIYQTVLEAQKLAIDHLGRWQAEQLRSHDSSEVDRIARDYIISKGYPTIPHSLGHGIGIEVHEAPRLSPKSKDILKKNMVFTIEPGIYITGSGGVRIEDVVVLEKNKVRLLTHSPKNLTIL